MSVRRSRGPAADTLQTTLLSRTPLGSSVHRGQLRWTDRGPLTCRQFASLGVVNAHVSPWKTARLNLMWVISHTESTSDTKSLLLFQLIGWSLKIYIERSMLGEFWYLPLPLFAYCVLTYSPLPRILAARRARSATSAVRPPKAKETASARGFHQRESLMAPVEKALECKSMICSGVTRFRKSLLQEHLSGSMQRRVRASH